MAVFDRVLDVDPIDWTTRDTSWVPGDGEIWYFDTHPDYDGVVYLIGDGTNVTGSLDLYASPFQGALIFGRLKTLTTGTYNAEDVSGYSAIRCDTSGGDITINGLTGGVANQALVIYKTNSANDLYLNHNSGSATDQALITRNALDIRRNVYSSVNFMSNGSNWFTDAEGVDGVTLTTGTYNAQDITSYKYVICSTSGGNITLNGFTGGIEGQCINIIKPSPSNSLIINHNSGSATDQAIITENSATVTKTAYGNIQAFCNGSDWFIDE